MRRTGWRYPEPGSVWPLAIGAFLLVAAIIGAAVFR